MSAFDACHEVNSSLIGFFTESFRSTIMNNINTEKPSMSLFWGCFAALVATAFAFITRMLLLGRFQTDFAIDKVLMGELAGAGVWPFAISIILFSLIIDKIGYRTAMIFSFVCYAVYLTMATMAFGAIQGLEGEALKLAQAKGYKLLYWGSIILGLGNGTVEAFINPVVATMFRKDKTKWLTTLHAGWPAGLVLSGLIFISMSNIADKGDWRLVLGIIVIPAVLYFIMLIGAKFPVSEREQAGVGYREMLKELGAFGALVAFGLIFAQLGIVFKLSTAVVWSLTALITILFGVYTKSFGRPILALLIIIMMPLAITEIGTDGWISSLMEKPLHAAGHHPGWVLIYTSAIMMFLRFFAGSVIHKFSPIGLLIVSAILAITGLFALSQCGDSGLAAIFAAATLYAIGKTFFWPTMLGVASEQSPKGGALSLNAISGIGMIAAGVLGFPYIGALQEKTASEEFFKDSPAISQSVSVEKTYILGKYQAIDPAKKAMVTEPKDLAALESADKAGQFGALGKMVVFPAFMLICFIGMFLYFKSKGGYKSVDLH
jgi:MFS family permease